MTTRSRLPKPDEPPKREVKPAVPSRAPPLTMQDRLRDIELMRQRVNGYAEYMATVDGMASTSTEAKEKAVTAFHERMTALEHQLGRIQEELRLG